MDAYRTEKRPEMTVMGIMVRTINAPDRAPKDIGALWQRFFAEDILNKIPNKASNEIVAFYCDYESDETAPYSLVVGCAVTSDKEVPEGMVVKKVPASSFAVFQAKGEHPKALIETWGKVWKMGRDLKRTYIGDYELYGEKFHGTPPEVSLFIAI